MLSLDDARGFVGVLVVVAGLADLYSEEWCGRLVCLRAGDDDGVVGLSRLKMANAGSDGALERLSSSLGIGVLTEIASTRSNDFYKK